MTLQLLLVLLQLLLVLVQLTSSDIWLGKRGLALISLALRRRYRASPKVSLALGKEDSRVVTYIGNL